MENPELVYFPLHGRGECMRMMFAMADVEYKNTIIPFVEWPKVRSEMPLQKLPILKVKEGTIVQSTSIARYVAKHLGFFGDNIWEETVCDMIMDSVNELMAKVRMEIYQRTLFKSEADTKKTVEECEAEAREHLIRILNMAEQLQSRNPATKYLNGEKITLADIILYCALDSALKAFPDAKKITPWTESFVENFESDEKVAAYLQTRAPSVLDI